MGQYLQFAGILTVSMVGVLGSEQNLTSRRSAHLPSRMRGVGWGIWARV